MVSEATNNKVSLYFHIIKLDNNHAQIPVTIPLMVTIYAWKFKNCPTSRRMVAKGPT
jgi:hypothetical protein